MSRRRHDSLSKDLLSLWLEPLGRVESPRRVHGEERQIDVVLVAALGVPEARGYRRHLGLLGRMARDVAALEPFRNPFTDDELLACIVKRVELHQEGRRRARRRGGRALKAPRTHLWVVTPTLSGRQRRRIGARRRRGYPAGFFDLADVFRATVVVASHLPTTPETLWLRLLGRGEVQQRALAELNALPEHHPLRGPTQRRVLRWRREAEQQATPTEADRELIMNTDRWVIQWEERVHRKGLAEGLAEGKAEGLRVAVGDLCELLGIALSASRKARLGAMGVGELEALRRAIKQTRRWPPAAAARPRAPRRTPPP